MRRKSTLYSRTPVAKTVSRPRPRRNPLKILITAGATREFLDSVRFLSNPASGAMGIAIAGEALKRGHRVRLICGPVRLPSPRGVRRMEVVSAKEMQQAVKRHFPDSDCLIMAAAVSDWRPRRRSPGKIKQKKPLVLRLVRNPDILQTAAGRRKARQVVIGFALETENLLRNAIAKLKAKNLDLIVGNKADARSSPFGEGRTSVIIVDRSGKVRRLDRVTKAKVAAVLVRETERLYREKSEVSSPEHGRKRKPTPQPL